MNFAIAILAGIAATAAFFFVEPHLFALDQPWKSLVTAAVFLVTGGLGYFLQRRKDAAHVPDRAVLSDNDFDQGLEVAVVDSEMSASGARTLSGNKVGGKGKIEIRNSKL